MTQTEAATAHRNNCFALYRAAVKAVPAEGTVSTRKRNAAQKIAEQRYSDYTFALGDVERAVRASMSGATERQIMDAAQVA